MPTELRVTVQVPTKCLRCCHDVFPSWGHDPPLRVTTTKNGYHHKPSRVCNSRLEMVAFCSSVSPNALGEAFISGGIFWVKPLRAIFSLPISAVKLTGLQALARCALIPPRLSNTRPHRGVSNTSGFCQVYRSLATLLAKTRPPHCPCKSAI